MPIQDGLSSSEAGALLGKYGANKLPEKPPPSWLIILVRQLKSPLVYVLLGAGIITLLLNDFSDSLMIFAAVLINTILGFIQEKRANDALHALKQMINPTAEVIRDGQRLMVSVEEVVRGDIAVLNQGYKVPADGELIHANRMFVGEAMLTGESQAVAKKRGDMVYMGTIVSGGRGYMRVKNTGVETEIGKIAASVQSTEEETPMKAQLRKFSKQLALFVLALTSLVFVVGLVGGRDVAEVFSTSVALAVSAIPEGLLVGLTVVLAIGMQRIMKKQGLVRNLVSAETLGGVTTICVDKTGTLTQGEMVVVAHKGKVEDLSIQSILANDLDDPVVLAAYDWGSKKVKKEIHHIIDAHTRLDSLPFSSTERFFASLHKWNSKENMIFVNGAPEYLLEWTDLPQTKKIEIREEIEALTRQGKRIVGMARKTVHVNRNSLNKHEVKSGLQWVGLLALSDPIRKGVKNALQKTQKAGINVLVITGDYAQTAKAVMVDLGFELKDNEIILGADLKKMSDSQLAAHLRAGKVKLFARTTPEQKLKIVNALKQNGEVVAMMGDGVNDAPALSKADIGIVVGDATDVAKETADLVLLDSSFNTIVLSIEEGRGIFDNIRKIILYLMCDAFAAIIAVFASILVGLPLTVTAAQILWVNLVADGLPNLALTIDPKQKGIMKLPPRSPSENLINRGMKFVIALVSVIGGLLVFAIFAINYREQGLEAGRSLAFALLGINTLVYVYSIKTLENSAWKQNPFNNPWLNIAVLAGLILQILPFVLRPLGEFLEIAPISVGSWSIVATTALFLFAMIEISKVIYKHSLSK